MIITKKLFATLLAVLVCFTVLYLPVSAEDLNYFEVKIPYGFEIISPFSNGSCFVNRGYEYGLLSTDGDYVFLTNIYNYAPMFDFTNMTESAYVVLYPEDYLGDLDDWNPFGEPIDIIYLFKNGEKYRELTPTPDGNYIVRGTNGYGILDSNGEVIVECKYLCIESDFSDGLLPVAIDYNAAEGTHSWKYIKTNGSDLNDTVYLTATAFHGGYANVTFEDDGKIMHGIINTDGDVVYSAENKYDEITQFYGNCAFGITYSQDEEDDYASKIEVFDCTGDVKETIYTNSYDAPGPIPVIDDSLQFLMSDIVDYNYNLVLIPMSENSIIFDILLSECMLYNTKNFELYEEVYSEVTPQYNGCIIIADSEGKYGYLDEDGNQVIECQYAYANYFSEGLAAVSTDGETFSYITEQGEPANIGTYSYAGRFCGGVAPVADENLIFGLIDTNGNTVLDFEYTMISDFVNGIAMVVDGEGKTGLINTDGDFIAPCEYDFASPIGFGDNCIVIKETEDKMLIYSLDQSGNKPIDADYDIILSVGEGMVLCGNSEDEVPKLYRVSISESTQKILDFKSSLSELPEELTDEDTEQINSIMGEYNRLNFAEQQVFYRYPDFWKVQKYLAKRELGNDYLVGDVDGDGKVSVTDIISVRGIILETYRFTPKQYVLADVNNDGRITVTDIVALRNIIMNPNS